MEKRAATTVATRPVGFARLPRPRLAQGGTGHAHHHCLRGEGREGEDREHALLRGDHADSAAKQGPHDDRDARRSVAQAVHAQQLARAFGQVARERVDRGARNCPKHPEEGGGDEQAPHAQREEPAKQSQQRHDREREHQRPAGSNPIDERATGDPTRHEDEIERENQVRDLERIRPKHIGGTSHDAHEVRRLKAQLIEKVHHGETRCKTGEEAILSPG